MKKTKKRQSKKQTSENKSQTTTHRKQADWESLIVFGFSVALFAGASFLAGSSILLALLFAVLVGCSALTYFDPKKWGNMPFSCAFIGAAIGCVVGLERTESWEMILLFILIGAVVGFFGVKWVPYISLP